MKKILALICAICIGAVMAGCSEKNHEYDRNNANTDISDVSENVSVPTTIDEGEVYTVKSGEELTIGNGQSISVNGTLNCERGGVINVGSKGSLLVNGVVNVSGDLVLNGVMGLSSTGEVSGEGKVYVGSFDDIDCAGHFTARIVPPEAVTENGVTKVGGVIIVNKKTPISRDYGKGLTGETLDALAAMRRDSGYEMRIISGFRDYDSQVKIFDNWCSMYGISEAETFSSRPGYSEHQTGLTIDITRTEEDYADTEEGKWVAENCWKYGFIIRYPKGKEDITGYTYEPWHLRYLGRSTAKLVSDSGLTLEEFLGVEGGDYLSAYNG